MWTLRRTLLIISWNGNLAVCHDDDCTARTAGGRRKAHELDVLSAEGSAENLSEAGRVAIGHQVGKYVALSNQPKSCRRHAGGGKFAVVTTLVTNLKEVRHGVNG